MKRDISGTSLATAVLLLATAVVLCTKLQEIESQAVNLPLLAVLVIESAFYAGVVYLWRGRLRLLTEIVGVAGLLAVRIGISAAAAASAQVAQAHRSHIGWTFLAPAWESWMAAAGFAVVSLYLVRGLFVTADRADTRRSSRRDASSQPVAAKVVFDSAPMETTARTREPEHDDTDARGIGDSLFRVLEPAHSAVQPAAVKLPPTTPVVEGWVAVPASLIAPQLPAGAQIEGDEVTVPLAAVMRRLREGEVRIPLVELDDVIVLPVGASDERATIELPLPLIVPQIPDEAFELAEAQPPTWLTTDTQLEEVFFAKV
jgi:hypothetical protein